MKLLTYRINQKKGDKGDLVNKFAFINDLYKNVLRTDSYWHYFLDPEGGTLRFLPKSEKKVLKFIKQYKDRFNCIKRKIYEPKKHEYYGVSYIGDDILPLFHEMSVLCAKFPPYIIIRPIHERLNHGLINMAGIHDFRYEAELYLDLAYRRASLVNYSFKLPRFVYQAVIKWQSVLNKFYKK